MSIHVALHHRTTYTYDGPTALNPQIIRLRPAPHCKTRIESYSLNVKPKQHFLNWQQDPHGNFQARLVFPEETQLFEIDVDLVADMAVVNPFDFFLEPEAEVCPFEYDPMLDEALAPFRRNEAPGPLLRALLDSIEPAPRPTIDFLVDLNRRLKREIDYVVRMEFGVRSPEATLSLASGSCRDTGWLLVQILRHLGFAARFVSGYLIQLAADQKPLDGPSGPESDFMDLHAWPEVYLPGSGWIGLDPTSGMFAAEGHLPLACTPEPTSAAPVTGSHDPAAVDFKFEMSVRRVEETPRVTKPYADEQWHRVVELGAKVDRDLEQDDVRLTMGGEPTFVSIDDVEGEEWNLAALGEKKRRLADDLLRRLADRFAPASLLHHGQGKWYPGEPLPRWGLSCLWRKGGEPVWRDRALIVDEVATPGDATIEDAERFATALVARLALDPRLVVPAFEDAWYYLLRERRLPVNVHPHDAKLQDPLERDRFARLFEGDLGSPVGYVLPIRREDRPRSPGEWRSAPWYFRHDTLFLLPGDSPIGYRLPLDALPWVKPEDYPQDFEEDPMAPRGRLSPRAALAVQRTAAPRGDDPTPPLRPPPPGTAAEELLRTALCVEPRNGHLRIFMPPLDKTEDYLSLVAAVEGTAAELDRTVVVEGYMPAFDPRIETFSITPDPGVIEVNIHPARDWGELIERTTALYEEARAARLGTEKFTLDGGHTGTGGGNHFVLGGPSPADSPFLRRPDLLRSLLAYWNNHPALSYLFSGVFIGPTSQHPRVDEARHEALYELEIAFQRVPEAEAGTPSPWLVDRLFCHLLVDVTGNTHRAEFCIDKLYSPDSVSGRRGLLELRAFEMPPHSRMSLAQQLLLRALVALFWRRPYKRTLVRWGTRLHDDFMLPHFVWRDFVEVIADLDAGGYEFDAAWFAPHFEFRFPQIGVVTHQGVTVELRKALEPWHVLGEQVVGTGTSRPVDSSVERLQVLASGQAGGRYVVCCNGYALPLRPSGTEGDSVAGLRYRAWQPASALHPTIRVHTPLLFDVFDTWNDCVLGGCTYHVSHPGGRSYETFPVNASEAEARRRTRFLAIGHTPAGAAPNAVEPSAEHPLTLDLRWAHPSSASGG